jgi:Zn finger protein HypA/HybF involved in hydrogenase expression
MGGVPIENLRCESSVISQDDAMGENAAQCGDIAIPCADCGRSAACKQHAVGCNKCGSLYVRVALTATSALNQSHLHSRSENLRQV